MTSTIFAAVREWIDATLPVLAGRHHVPGASVAFVVNGETHEACTGVINQRTQVPVTPDTLFMIQSVTKVCTATLVMQLVDRGLLDLDLPVRAYLSEFRTADLAASGRITARHLLTHTAGFEGDLWIPTTADSTALLKFVDHHVAEAAQVTEPGRIYSYCSAGYGVLGRLVEVLTAMPYEEAFRNRLAVPLGIDELAFSADQALAFRTAIGHGPSFRPLNQWALLPPSNHPAGNQLAMSARGLLRFARLHLSAGDLSGEPVLSGDSMREMRRRHVDRPGQLGGPSGQGLGWSVPGDAPTVEHGGGIVGSTALLRVLPHRAAAVVLLANSSSGGALFEEVLGAFADRFGWDAPSAPAPPEASAFQREVGYYVGTYQTRLSKWRVAPHRDRQLLLTAEPTNMWLTLLETAGVPAAASPVRRLRLIRGDTFAVMDNSGNCIGGIEFIGKDDDGRSLLLHDGRVSARRQS